MGSIEQIRGLVGLGQRARGLSVGSRETRDGLRRGKIHLVLLARDGSPRDRQRLERVAGEACVPTREVGTRVELPGVEMVVEMVEDQRIKRVRLIRSPEEEEREQVVC